MKLILLIRILCELSCHFFISLTMVLYILFAHDVDTFFLMQEDVKDMVEKFLEYVMNNHSVNRGQATMLQAFQISLVRISFSNSLFGK